MTTDTQSIQPFSDRDYLEFLMHKLKVMKDHGNRFYAGKSDVDKRLFDTAKKEVNDFLLLLKKRGFDGSRFANLKSYEQASLFK